MENLISKLNFYKLISYLVDRCICPARAAGPTKRLLARWLYSLPAGALHVRAHAYFLLLFAPCLSPLGMFVAGKAGWESLCPLGKILTKIYNLQNNYPLDGGQLNSTGTLARTLGLRPKG